MKFEPINLPSEFSEDFSNAVDPNMIAQGVQGIGNIAQAFKANPEAAARRQALRAKKKQCGRIPLVRIGKKAKEKAQKVRDCIARLEEEERQLELSLAQKASEKEAYKADTARAIMESARQKARTAEMQRKKWYETGGGIAGIVIGGLLVAGVIGFVVYKKVA